MAVVLKPPRGKSLLPPAFGSRLTIDWTNPLTNGLIGCFILGNNAGLNLAGAPDLTLGTAAKIGVSVEGPGLVSNAANTGATATVGTASPFTNWTVGFSIYTRFYKLGVGSDFSDHAAIEYDNANGLPYLVAGICDSGWGDTSRVNTQWNTGGTFTQGVGKILTNLVGVNSVGATFTIGGNALLYQEGVQTDSAAFGASAPNSSATSTITLGTRRGATTLFTNTTHFVSYFWNRALSANEMALLDADPYAFLIPAEGEMPSLSSPGIVPTTYIAFSVIQ